MITNVRKLKSCTSFWLPRETFYYCRVFKVEPNWSTSKLNQAIFVDTLHSMSWLRTSETLKPSRKSSKLQWIASLVSQPRAVWATQRGFIELQWPRPFTRNYGDVSLLAVCVTTHKVSHSLTLPVWAAANNGPCIFLYLQSTRRNSKLHIIAVMSQCEVSMSWPSLRLSMTALASFHHGQLAASFASVAITISYLLFLANGCLTIL